MPHFTFIAGTKVDRHDFSNYDAFIDVFPDGQTVFLESEAQLRLLLKLLGIDRYELVRLTGAVFEEYFDISNSKFPAFDDHLFDLFYSQWLNLTGRGNTMDEYGSLIFLNGVAKDWNEMKCRLIVRES